jgi:hypothetical protein
MTPPQRITVEVFRVVREDCWCQIGLSAGAVRRLFPRCVTDPDYVIESSPEEVAPCDGEVRPEVGGDLMLHWRCPFCEGEHSFTFEPEDANCNPLLWFCPGLPGHPMCLIRWRHARPG